MQKKGFNRRRFLKNAAATGAIATGFFGGTGIVSAEDNCFYLGVKGESGHTDYSITVGNSDVYKHSDTEGNDRIAHGDNDTIIGSINGGYADTYGSSNDFRILSVDVNGGAVVIYSGVTDQVVGCPPSSVEPIYTQVKLDISGNGEYTVGYWVEGRLTGRNLESSEVNVCYPSFTKTGKPQLTCTFDIEGVVTGDVDGTTYDFGTGDVHGHQYTDTFVSNAQYGTSGPAYLYLNGDINVNMTYTM